MTSVRSTTGCFTCKVECRCDDCSEINPQFFHRQHSRIEEGVECPGYANIEQANKPNRNLQTHTVSRTLFDRSRGSPLANTDELEQDLIPCVNPDSNTTHPSIGVVTPTTSGLISPLKALSCLGQPPDVDLPSQCAHLTNDSPSDPSSPLSLTSNLTSPDTGKQGDAAAHDEEDVEGTLSLIRRGPVLDKTAKSNALPFVLQGYATWINRLALDPLKLTNVARDFVFSHFEDGEQSRWIIALLANIGSKIGKVEFLDAAPDPMISALQTAVRRRLDSVRSRPHPNKSDLITALDSAMETMAIHFYANSPMEAMALRLEAGPIFRQLCSEPPDAPIDLSSVLQHPLGSLRQYAGMNIVFSVVTDIPTFFQYKVPVPTYHPSNPSPSLPTVPEDDELIPNEETVASLEQDIRELQPFTGSSSDRFLAIIRTVVQECWRQAAFIYLYMVGRVVATFFGQNLNTQQAVCGDSSNTPRVVEAFKRFMRLLNGTRPGRLPDEFLTSPLIIVAPAAQRSRDREAIRRRAVALHQRGRTFLTNDSVLGVIEDYWARSDADERPIVWSDVAVSRRRILGM